METSYINIEKIEEALFNDSEYIIEFCEAGVASFDEFIENYQKHLLNRNIEELREAGHKIKPGAQMMGVEEVVEEYEQAKQLLMNDVEQNLLHSSAEKMKGICTAVQDELTQLAQKQN